MRAKYVLSEVLVGLWRNVTMTIAMMITMAVSLFLMGMSWLLYQQIEQMKDYYYAKIEVSIFLDEKITPEQRENLGAALRSDELVAGVTYESKEQAYENFKTLYADTPDLVKAIKADQLPDSFRVKLKNPEQFEQISVKYRDSEGIDEIVDQRKLLGKIFDLLGGIQKFALFVAGFMAVAALLLVGNMIQVAAYSKRREVAVMKLVGASNWFIQAPFVLEAIAAGVVGAIVAFGGLLGLKLLLLDGSLKALTDLLTPLSWGDIWLTLPLMAGVGALVSSLTAWVTLRFYLRV
ncbi:MAG TPA: permease-like cell division protein FtsX [Pilimelia sp.]|nr:permease-like cell division protein FtsX [Pilimelia sp.]